MATTPRLARSQDGVANMSNRLLVIDDANIHRMILCRIGEKVGFETTGAASYEEAAKLLRENEFDCITLDLSLGDRAGVEVLQADLFSDARQLLAQDREVDGLRHRRAEIEIERFSDLERFLADRVLGAADDDDRRLGF